MKQKIKEVLEFFDGYPTKVQAVALGLRAIVRSAMPGAREMLDRSARIVGYGFGPGYADTICVIIPRKKGVKLGIVRGTELLRKHRPARSEGSLGSGLATIDLPITGGGHTSQRIERVEPGTNRSNKGQWRGGCDRVPGVRRGDRAGEMQSHLQKRSLPRSRSL